LNPEERFFQIIPLAKLTIPILQSGILLGILREKRIKNKLNLCLLKSKSIAIQ